MSKDLYKNSLLVILLLFFYYKQKEDIDVYLNIITKQFKNIKCVINNYLSIILSKKNKNTLKRKIDDVKVYFFKSKDLKEEDKTTIEIILPKVNIVDIKADELKPPKKSSSYILNILLNKYVILSIILLINYYKRTFINKPVNSNNTTPINIDVFDNSKFDGAFQLPKHGKRYGCQGI